MRMDDFDRLYEYAVTNLETLVIDGGISANTFEDFAVEWGRTFAIFFQATLQAYKGLYIDAMSQAADLQTIESLGMPLEPLEQTLLDAAQATTDGPKRLGDIEVA
jgi:hypothetical protein